MYWMRTPFEGRNLPELLTKPELMPKYTKVKMSYVHEP